MCINKILLTAFLSIIFLSNAFTKTLSPQDYLHRFENYVKWRAHMPLEPNGAFLRFIKEDTPLANKLRERWLYQLAEKKDWDTYLYYYKKSHQTGLNCYAEYAKYLKGARQSAMNAGRSLWLSGYSLPNACNLLFDAMRQDPSFDERFIDARIILALNQDNPQLVNYLLPLYRQPKLRDKAQFNEILKDPRQIAYLPNDNFHGYFYVFGLKKLFLKNQRSAILYWQMALKQHRLSEGQQQQFLTFVTLYKAQKHDPSAHEWFQKINPAFYNDALLDWQIRAALTKLNWTRIERLIHYYQNKNDPCWQYWLARSLEAQGKVLQAESIYTTLAKNRNYYGFLSSIRLKQALTFDAKTIPNNQYILNAYQPIMNQIAYLKQTHRLDEAAELATDFSSELPKEQKASFIHWIAHRLEWYPKAIALSSNEELKDHLSLRFPVAYETTVDKMVHKYQLPKAFIYAVIRQESLFNHNVTSQAGARGLMQLMPATAKQVAKNNLIAYQSHDDLFKAQTNISLGSAYLNFLAQRFQKHPILMAAAYNAGPRQVLNWLEKNTANDIDIWIETIPFKETRNYLKNIFAFYAVYQYQLQNNVSLKTLLKPINMKKSIPSHHQ